MLKRKSAPLQSRAEPAAFGAMSGKLARSGWSQPRASVEQAIGRAVWLVLGNARAARWPGERRRAVRHPFPYPIRLIPVEADGVTPSGEEIVVLGKHLSEGGVDFYHREPVTARRVLAVFPCRAGSVRLLLELTWCRYGSHGWYENGGRFVRLVDAPLPRPAARPAGLQQPAGWAPSPPAFHAAGAAVAGGAT